MSLFHLPRRSPSLVHAVRCSGLAIDARASPRNPKGVSATPFPRRLGKLGTTSMPPHTAHPRSRSICEWSDSVRSSLVLSSRPPRLVAVREAAGGRKDWVFHLSLGTANYAASKGRHQHLLQWYIGNGARGRGNHPQEIGGSLVPPQCGHTLAVTGKKPT